MKILMVCLGNICRSPLAEGIMQKKAKEEGLNWQIDSAGTGAWHVGEKPDPRSIATADAYGLDIRYQRARQFIHADFAEYDLILAMDRSNYQNILRLAQTEMERAKVAMILDYSYPNQGRSVPDPYWDNDGFQQVYTLLDQACTQVLEVHKNK